MPRIHQLTGALALALSGAGVAQAQEFTNVVSFGDSLTDAGNIALISGLPPGFSFTTNPDPVAAELVAGYFGFTQTNSLSGGLNYAYGGACVRIDVPCVNSPSSFSITTQVSDYLTSTGGSADPNALYTMFGGANDVFTSAGNPLTAQTNTGIAALTEIGLIGSLQSAGARYIVVYNLPDIGLTPQFFGTPNQAGVTGLSFAYNSTLDGGLATLGDGIIPINVFGLVNDVMANPSAYGFSNVTGIACGPGVPGAVSSVACGPAGAGLPYSYAPGDNQTFFFADGVHPTGAAQALLASAVISTIIAPGQVSLAGEVPLQVYEDHSATINREVFALRGIDRPEGDVRAFGNLEYGNQTYDASSNTLSVDSNIATLTAGADFRYSDSASFGGAVSFSNSNSDNGVGGIDGREVLGSVYGVFTLGGGYIDGILSGGSNSLDISRAIPLGPSVRNEKGNTDASHFGFEIGGGYVFNGKNVQHGPFANVTWQQIDVDGYTEDSNDSTSMYFNDFSRDSLVGRLGYQLDGSFSSGSVTMHPYGRLAYAWESKDDVTTVQAGSTSMNGHFTMSGFIPSSDWLEAELGLSFDVNDKMQAFFGYRGHFNDDSQSRDSLNLGLRMAF